MARQAINDGKGVIVMEPHGKLVDEIAQLVPEERQKDVLYFDFSDSEYPVPFNFMKVQQGKNKRKSKSDLIDETAEEFLNIMKNIFSDSWGIRTEKIFRHTGKALMEAGEGGLWNAKQMLKNKDYRSKVVKKVKNIAVKDFWTTEFTGKTASDGTFRLDSDIRNAIDSPLTKIDRFLSSERVLYMVGQEECIDFDECINSNKIVLFKIPKGDLKEDNTKFLGNIIFSKLMMAFMSRTPEEMKHETLMIADEVQNFVTTNPKDFELLMDELRKYGVCFVMAHQRVPQIQSIISAVRDNVGTTVCFRLGEESSSYMQKSFDGFLECKDLEKLENRYAYVKTLVDGKKTDPFLIKTLDKEDVPEEVASKRLSTIIELNRDKRRSRDEIEKELRKRIEDFDTVINDFKQEMDNDYVSAFTGSGNDDQDGACLPDEWV
jgi:siroheme synthase (precorrin-2 oxidase/ferrochelatase)